MHNMQYETKCIALNENGEIIRYIARISKHSFSMPGVGYVKILCIRNFFSGTNFNKRLILTEDAVKNAIKRGKKTNDLLRDFNKVLGIFNAGDIVEHSVFGKGKVLSLSGLESNESARVRFNKGGEKNLILKYANLRLVGHWNATSIFKTIIQEIK